MDGLDELDELFEALPKTAGEVGDFRMYVDRTYNVQGVGAVASAPSNPARSRLATNCYGTDARREFQEVEVRSIEMHYHRVDRAKAGRIVGIALKGVREAEIERGMVLLPSDADPSPVQEFEARLCSEIERWDRYETVVHLKQSASRGSSENGSLSYDVEAPRMAFQLLFEGRGEFSVRFPRPFAVVGTVTDTDPAE